MFDTLVVIVLAGIVVALGIQVVLLNMRLTQSERELCRFVGDLPPGESLSGYVNREIERELSRCAWRAFEEAQREMGEEVRRAVRREAEEVFERTGFQGRLDQAIEDKLTRGAFLVQVRRALEEHDLAIRQYVDRSISARLPAAPGAPSNVKWVG